MSDPVELEGEIVFFQACVPAMAPGEYRVDVTQTIDAAGEPYRSSLDFTVAGPRFSLQPADVHSVYPPAGQTGGFDNALPHIVLTRRTLPWERTLDGGRQSQEEPCPWLALLVISDDDTPGDEPPAPTPRKVGELLCPGDGIRGPEITLDDKAESENDLCNTLDLPRELFERIVPAREDLPYLAHAREVDTRDKETLSYLGEGCLAVVVANRFPATEKVQAGREDSETGMRNRACLVSLEGFQDCLHGSGQPIEEATVRLAVLADWTFTCRGTSQFKDLMVQLDDGEEGSPPGRLSLPSEGVTGDGADTVVRALEHGYVGLDHTVRVGEKTVSWYRGPLVPLALPRRWKSAPFPSADAALRFDAENGLMDTAYAAAWQLGRLLALQNRSFAQELAQLRRRQAAAEESAARRRVKGFGRRGNGNAAGGGRALAREAIAKLTSGKGKKALERRSAEGGRR